METGQTFIIRSAATLGRGTSSTIVIPDSFVSIDHAHITWQRGQWWLEDRHSRNGTSLNNLPVTETMVLSSGDEIGIGRITLRLELDSSL
jgi:pSer/pThr/pTyr-binding forkhead associated (FHA) protein